MKKLVIGESARKQAVDAMNLIADAVGSTLGPQGRPFVFERLGADQRYKPTVSKDGLTVLNSLEFNSPIANAVHFFAQQAAAHSVMASGDGTTSTCVLAAAVAQSIHESKDKVIPQAFARQLKKEAQLAIEEILKEADKSEDCIRKVAMTSANGDEELAEVALEAIEKSSAFGTVIAEKSPASKVRYKITRQDGYVGAKGYNYNNYFAGSCSDLATQNAPIEWENVHVMCLNGALMTTELVPPILSAFNQIILEKGDGQRLVIFAYEISDQLIDQFVVFNRKMASRDISIWVAKPRLTAETNSGLQIMRDVAAYTASNMIDGGNYKTMTSADFGLCKKMRITPTQTILLGRADNHWVDKRCIQNDNIVKTAESEFDKEITSIRNAELANGLVKVEIGGGMGPELQERADRFDDAVKAAQACMRSGALPGCGASYIRAGELAGVCHEMKKALKTIHETIMANYGASPMVSFIAGQTISISDSGTEIGNFKDVGVVDAAETVCAVIKNGVDLGIEIATMGGYSLIDSEDLSTIQRTRTVREVL